jgi:glucan phosphoethanolaminetransferase (alkaline phosphatase superfamily)
MQMPVIAGVEHPHPVAMSEPIKCAIVVKPTRASRHKKEMLRYLVLVIALLAVVLLIAIALYYTQGNSVSIEHVSSLAPHLTPARLS